MQDILLPRVQHAFQRAFHLDPRGHATLACSLEHEFNVHFEIDELMALEDVREIVRIVRGKLGGAA